MKRKVLESNNLSTQDTFKYVVENMEEVTGVAPSKALLEAMAYSFNDAEKPSAIGKVFQTQPAIANAWLSTYTNKITMQKVSNKLWSHPIVGLFLKGTLTAGETIEDTLFDLIQSMPYSFNTDGARNYKDYTQKQPEHAFYTVNMIRDYIQTKYVKRLVKAMLSWDTLQSALDAYDTAYYTSINEDAFLMVRYALASAIINDNIRVVAMPTNYTTKDFIETQRNLYDGMAYLSPNFAKTRIPTHASDRRYMMDFKFKNKINVQEYSTVYGPGYEQFAGSLLEINCFSFTPFEQKRINQLINQDGTAANNYMDATAVFTSAQLTALAKIKGIMFDPEIVQNYVTYERTWDEYDGYGDKMNHGYELEEMWCVSPFACAVAIADTGYGITAMDAVGDGTWTAASKTLTLAAGKTESLRLSGIKTATLSYDGTSGDYTYTFDEDSGILEITCVTKNAGKKLTVTGGDAQTFVITFA